MKRIIVILLMLLVISSLFIGINEIFAKALKIDLRLKEDEMAVTFVNNKKLNSFFIIKGDEALLLVLDMKDNNIEDILNKFKVNKVMMLTIKDIDYQYQPKVLLAGQYNHNGILYKLNKNIIKISYNDTDFCIYLDRGYKDSNFDTCNFIYFYNVKNIPYFEVNDRMDIVFYHHLKPLPTELLTRIYERWIDTYMINENEYTIIKIAPEYYNIVVIPNT